MKTKYKFSIGLALAGLILVPLFFWLGGYDFNQRGEPAVTCALLTLLVAAGGAVAAATYPERPNHDT